MLSLHEHVFNSFPFNSPYNSSCLSILSYQYRRVFNFTKTKTLNPCTILNCIKKNFHFTRGPLSPECYFYELENFYPVFLYFFIKKPKKQKENEGKPFILFVFLMIFPFFFFFVCVKSVQCNMNY